MKKKNKLLMLLVLLAIIVIPKKIYALQLFVKTVNNETITLTVDANDSISTIKEKIENEKGILEEDQILVFSNKLLRDSNTLADYNIFNGDTILMKKAVIILGTELLSDDRRTNTLGTATYDSVNNILTLDNYGEDFIEYIGKEKLEVVLENTNTIYPNTIPNNKVGFKAQGADVIFTGDGTLEINGGEAGIIVGGNLEVDKANIVINDCNIMGINVKEKATINGNITVNAYSYGIVSNDELIINGGNINVETVVVGVGAVGNIKINGGYIDITAGEADKGIAMLLFYEDDSQDIKLADNMYVIQDNLTIQKTMIPDNSTLKLKTYGQAKVSIRLNPDVLSPNVAYKLTIKPKNKVTFNSNGGSEVNSQFVKDNEKAIRPLAPVKDGYKFENWYIDEKLTTLYDFEKTVTDDITLYAKWEEENPNTGDNIMSMVIINMISLMGIIGCSLYLYKIQKISK